MRILDRADMEKEERHSRQREHEYSERIMERRLI
jgi:hypothetical protein